ncbi:MAG: DEAD/DEAH box helicase [Actinomycetes bacterium]
MSGGDVRLGDLASADPDALYTRFTDWVHSQGIVLYPHQDEALVDVLAGANVIVTTPTGSGKSLIATGAHLAAWASGGRTYYTAPIKALVSEKFFALVDTFGAANVGMVTGDASVNADAAIVCCTAEILANIALREGARADVAQVVMDEFHFVADRDRGWAWHVPLIELPQAQFVIMSATLGDTTHLARLLERTTGRPTSVVSDAVRPVPLSYRWSLEPIHDTVAEIVQTGQAPVYIVHATQAAAVERAQALTSGGLVDKERRAQLSSALKGFTFAAGFGKTLDKLLGHGVAVHHAGMLPRYRRLVETLAQRGLLAVVCGTDTLGVGINLPIRTVLFSTLTKFDGRRTRVLRSREFHQVAGRAGRAGFDTVGYVVAQAPEHEVENARIAAKFADDPEKLRSVRRKKPPEGFVNYTEATFGRLVESQPEELHPRMRITHAMLLNLLQRDEDTGAAIVRLIDSTTSDRAVRRGMLRRAAQIGRSLLRAGVVTRLARPTAGGRRHALNVDLQADFALNQPLSAFALAVIETLDPDAPGYALDVVSVIESTLDSPTSVLLQQQFRARGEAVAELKADGYDYEERLAVLDEVTWPRPLAGLLEDALAEYATGHPWLLEAPPTPKSVVRDMYERGMTFGEFVAHYKIQRSEGLLLRYLSDAWRALRQTVPEAFRTDELADLIAWLGEVTRLVDSSLLDEWAALAGLAGEPDDATDEVPPPSRPVTGNERAFRVLVRNALWRRVELMADDDVDALAALEGGAAVMMTRSRWHEAFGAYWDEHDSIGTGADARGPALFVVTPRGRRWEVRQIVDDPAGNHDWALTAEVDLDASDEAGELAVRTIDFSRLD